MEAASDLELKLERWQGCAGQAWGYNAPVVGDLKLPTIQGGSTWGLTPQQFEITEKLATVLSLPVRHPENETPIAILNFDTEESITDILIQDRHKKMAFQVAKQVGLLLFGFGQIDPLL